MQADESFWDSLVFDGIDDVDVEAVTAAFGTVDVMARGRAAGAACPDCGRFSDRAHDSYQRRLKDLPLGGQSVVIRLMVRRFLCGAGACPRRTFAEPFPQLTAPYARFAMRLNHVLEHVPRSVRDGFSPLSSTYTARPKILGTPFRGSSACQGPPSQSLGRSKTAGLAQTRRLRICLNANATPVCEHQRTVQRCCRQERLVQKL
ncbi:transposase family protein [Streptomyces sp. NPDC002324]